MLSEYCLEDSSCFLEKVQYTFNLFMLIYQRFAKLPSTREFTREPTRNVIKTLIIFHVREQFLFSVPRSLMAGV